ncbi:(2Fe-2S)-binding protein [Sanguibacter sp. A247]|uniref:(2Fe-2S)-binding protein n=1 Tax=unclassified Sanguibacter TaxID=2645534 RepID=UPI003FD7A15A
MTASGETTPNPLEALRAKLAEEPMAVDAEAPVVDAATLPDDYIVCHCTNVTAGELRGLIHEAGCSSLDEIQRCTRAGGSCGKCVPLLTEVVTIELGRAGIA